MASDTFPKLLREKALEWGGDQVAIRTKEFGLWQSVSWAGYFEQVKWFALGLKALGLERGDHVCVIGNNEPEWLYAELAVQSLGGVVIGIYQDSTPSEVRYIVEKSDSVFVVAEDQEQIDKLLEIAHEIDRVKKIVYWDPRGMRPYHDTILIDFKSVQKAGQQLEQAQPAYFDDEIDPGTSADLALILATSGTTSFPKLAMLSYRNMLLMAENLLVEVDPMKPEDEFVSALPLAWVGEQMMAVSGALRIGFAVHFPEEPTTTSADIREIAPQVMFSPPRVWEDMLADIQVRISDTSVIKKLTYQLFMESGWRHFRLMHWFGDLLLFRVLRDKLGLARIRNAYTGGAALGPEVFKFYHDIGVNLKQIYGQTEISGISVTHRTGDIKYESVGCPIPDTEIRISETGEILSRSPSVFQGYYGDSEATESALSDGWLHSGDAGYIDPDGHLVVVDRLQDVVKLSDGELFSPQSIENMLKYSPYVREAVVFGQSRDHVTAFVNVDYENVGKWAEKQRIAYTSYTDLSQKSEVYSLVRKEVRRVNARLSPSARIYQFVNLYKELDADDQELTRTKKVRRRFIEEKYSTLVDALNGDEEQVTIQARVQYRDGREEDLTTEIRVARP